MDMLYKSEVMAIFVIFWPMWAKIWSPWQCPLDLCSQKCLLWICQPQKPPVISNHILVISRRNAFIAILVQKLVTMVTPPSLVYCDEFFLWSRWILIQLTSLVLIRYYT